MSNLVLYGPLNVASTGKNSGRQPGSSSTSVNSSGNSRYLGIGVNAAAGTGGNASGNSVVNVGIGANFGVSTNISLDLASFNSTTFVIKSGGQLQIPSSRANFTSSGTAFDQGSNATLSYSGTMSFDSGRYIASLKPGAQYKIVVTTLNGSSVTATVTAR